jgi:hypothetical protein
MWSRSERPQLRQRTTVCPRSTRMPKDSKPDGLIAHYRFRSRKFHADAARLPTEAEMMARCRPRIRAALRNRH